MKVYNYFAFSTYKLLEIVFKKDNERILVLKTSFIISLLILLVLYSIKGIFELNGYNDTVIPPLYIFLLIVIIWLPNYIYLNKKNFLMDNNVFSLKNVIQVLLFIITVVAGFIIIANKNRERIFRERGYSEEMINNGGKEAFDPQKKPESLEEKIRLWYYNTFEKKDSTDIK
ncbi:hypothetical protein [Chryseobacterium takakiae]|jgi:glucan phosphoethanolaminetransferase (alkaline phosphatase superfamily)|uniref:Uncharacterized protein n=1 Tax=Chryseobacterium takakiae TaxID=1302685 RepID=A0A1M5A0I7_9FLAO|nr:hypothetical protein [Chryseobacterium takakiae]SHF23820.1 hypothetical protein SAMN05444408_111120 [Chryseobacterium takakiae]